MPELPLLERDVHRLEEAHLLQHRGEIERLHRLQLSATISTIRLVSRSGRSISIVEDALPAGTGHFAQRRAHLERQQRIVGEDAFALQRADHPRRIDPPNCCLADVAVIDQHLEHPFEERLVGGVLAKRFRDGFVKA